MQNEISQPAGHHRRVIVIGAGITGLTAAWRLSTDRESPCSVTVLEAGDQPGGSITTTRADGFLLEHGPDSFISIKPWGIALCRDLGIEDQLIGTNPQYRRSYIVRRGRLHPVPDGFYLLAPSSLWPMVHTPIFSLRGKLRMAMDLILPRRLEQTDESLACFVRRRLGQEALERMAQPMIGGIYAADPEKLSLKATMPQFIEMERVHRSIIRALMKRRGQSSRQSGIGGGGGGTSGPRYGLFLSFRDGMQTLTDALLNRLPAGTMRLRSRVMEVRRDGFLGCWQVQLDTGECLESDAVCLAIPAPAAGRLLTPVDGRLAQLLSDIVYGDSTTVNLAFRREDVAHPLEGMGFVIPEIEHRAILGCSFSSMKFTGRSPDGTVLLRVFLGAGRWADRTAISDEIILNTVFGELRELLGIRGTPLRVLISRYSGAMANYYLGHLDRVRSIETAAAAIPGLALAGSGYEGIGIPDCINSANKAVEKLRADFLSTAV